MTFDNQNQIGNPFPEGDRNNMTATAPKKERPKIFGLGITQLIHWMRDKKFTVAEVRHVFRSLGLPVVTKQKSHGQKCVSDHAIRAHLHCFPKFCKARAKRIADKAAVEQLLKLRKETPEDEPVPQQKPPKAAKAPAKPKAKKAARKKSDKGTRSLRSVLP